MKRLFIAVAVSAGALLGGSAANAADNTVKAKAATDVTQQSTDFSSHGRHYRHYRHYGYRHYRPYYRSYGYASAAVLWPVWRRWTVLWRWLWLWRAERKL